MAVKDKLQFSQVENLIKEFKKANPLKAGERYTFEQLMELDKEICGYIAENKQFANGMIYYSYHTVWYIMKLLDPSFAFTYAVNNLTTYDANGIASGLKGFWVKTEYTSTTIPQYLQPIPFTVADKAFKAILAPDGRELDFSIQRSFVKTIAFNTGFGLMNWLKPDFVKAQASEKQQLGYAQKDFDANIKSKSIAPKSMAPTITPPPIMPQVQSEPIQPQSMPQVQPVTFDAQELGDFKARFGELIVSDASFRTNAIKHLQSKNIPFTGLNSVPEEEMKEILAKFKGDF